MSTIHSKMASLKVIFCAAIVLNSLPALTQEEATDSLQEPPPDSLVVPPAGPAEAEMPLAPPVEDEKPAAQPVEPTQAPPKAEEEKQSEKIGGLTKDELLLLLLPDEVDAKEGYLPPTGYEEVVKPRYGLLAAGASLFACSLIKMIVFAGITEEGALIVPVIGPLLAADQLEELMPIFIVDMVAQASGLTMILVGVNSKKKKWVRKKPEKTSFLITPTVLGSKGAGLGLRATF